MPCVGGETLSVQVVEDLSKDGSFSAREHSLDTGRKKGMRIDAFSHMRPPKSLKVESMERMEIPDPEKTKIYETKAQINHGYR